MRHRQRAQIKQQLPETVGQVVRAYFFGVLGVCAFGAGLIFLFGLLEALR